MNIFKRLKNTSSAEAAQEKQPVISRRFIIAISIIYSLLIIGTAAAFHITAQKNTAILRDALAAQGQELLIGRIERHVEHLRSVHAATPDAVKKELLDSAAAGDLHAVIIFTKTEDENYFRIADTVIFTGSLKLDLDRLAVVREKKEISYLKKGMLQKSTDPVIYSQGSYYWQNVFYPYEFGSKKGVLQFMASAAETQEIIDGYAESTGRIRTFMVILSVILVIAVGVLSIVFIQNYTLLIRNLSRYMKKAADGDLNISLNAAEDVELNQLALSFNTLIEELKEKTEKTSQVTETQPGLEVAPEPETPSKPEAAPEPEGPGDIFATGVSLLKDNKLDDAIAIFRTMTIIKPNGFGSYFNLGVAYAKKREYDKALLMFETAREINPAYELIADYIEKIKRLRDPDD